MIYSYEFTELAINDIDETLNYITNNLCNKKAAVDLMKDIEKSIYNICMFSLAYPDCKYYYMYRSSTFDSIMWRGRNSKAWIYRNGFSN